jgi:carboxyl-terminal processing protease
VKEIVPGGPADLGRQLKPNDKIIEVAQDDAEPVEIIGMKLRKIVDQIRGAKGTKVRLIVQPGDATDTSVRKEIVITRDVVKLDSARARAAVFQVPGPTARPCRSASSRCPSSTAPPTTATPTPRRRARARTSPAHRAAQAGGIQGLVLDLRHNGGGYLSEAIELAGLFIHKGPSSR